MFGTLPQSFPPRLGLLERQHNVAAGKRLKQTEAVTDWVRRGCKIRR